MGAVEVYVVRIYRRFPDEPDHVEGIVETPGNHESFPFRMREELLRLVFPDVPGKRKLSSEMVPKKVTGPRRRKTPSK